MYLTFIPNQYNTIMNTIPKTYPRPYIHVYEHQMPCKTVIRFAKTPTGRRSKFWHAQSFYKVADGVSHETIAIRGEKTAPKLRKNYTWGEWFIYP